MTKSSYRRTQSKRILRAAIAASPAVIAAFAFAQTAKAADAYWDVNGTTAGGASTTTAAGTWNASNTNWSPDTTGDGTSATTTWTAGDNAVFAAGTNVTGTYTVTVSGTQTVSNINFQEGQVTLSGGTLDLGSGQRTINTTSTSASVTQQINSIITGTGGILRTGGTGSGVPGSQLRLGSANTYGGITQINAGVTRISNGSALGVAGDIGSGNETIFDNSSNSAAIHLSRLDLAGGIDVVGEGIRVTSGGGRSLQGQLNSGSGTNTWSGNIQMAGMVNNEGTGLASLGAASGATLVINGATISNPGTVTASTSTGAWWGKTGAGTVVLRNTTTTTLGSVRVLNGTLVVQNDGALGAAPTTNITDINESVLIAALSGNTPTLAFQAPPASAGFEYSTRRFIRTAGTAGTGGIGEIANLGGANTFVGELNANLGTTIGISSGSLELAGAIWGAATTARTINKIGTGELIISSTNTGANGSVAGDVGNLGNNQFGINAGTFTVSAGTLTFRNNPTWGGTGSLSSGGTMGFIVKLGSTLQLDNSMGVNTSRLGATAPIALAEFGAEFKLNGHSTTAVTQAVGSLEVASYSTVTVTTPGATTELQLPSTSRSNRGTLLLRGVDNTNTLVRLTTANLQGGSGAGTQKFIVPELVGDTSATGVGTDFVTASGAGPYYLQPLTAGDYLALASGNTTRDNTIASAGTTNITGDTTVNAVKFDSSGGAVSIAITSGKRLSVLSGAMLGVGTANSTFAGGEVAFHQYYPAAGFYGDTGAYGTDPTGDTTAVGISDGVIPTSGVPSPGVINEGIITVPTGSTLIQASDNVIGGAQGLTKSGGGTLRLQGTNTFGGSRQFWYYDGSTVYPVPGTSGAPVTINAGVLEFNVDANLGHSASPIFINGGTLRPLSTSVSTRNITLASPGTNIIDAATGADFATSGLVTGNSLTKNGGGILELTNTANSYVNTTINAGYVRMLPSAAVNHPELGTGTVTLAGGSLRTEDTTVWDRNIVAAGSTSQTTGGFWIAATKTLTFGAAATSTFAITGSGNLAVDGGGTLILAKVNGAQITHSGRYYIQNASTLRYEPNSAGNHSAGIGSPPAAGNLWNLSGGSTLSFGVNSTTLSGFGGANAGIDVAAGNQYINVDSGNSIFSAGSLSGTGTYNKLGAGEFGFRAKTAAGSGNTGFSGNFVISNGTFSIGDQSIALTGGTETLLGTGSGTGAGTEFIKIAGGAEFLYRQGNQSLTINNTRDIGLTSGMPILGASAGTFQIDGVIRGASATGVQIDARGAGVIAFGGANTYAGDTLIKTVAATGGSASTLRMAAANALPSTTTVRFNAQTATAAAILDMGKSTTGGFSQTVATITQEGPAGTATITNTGTTPATLSITSGTAITWDGKITGGANMNVSLPGDITLTGTGNNFGGLLGDTGNAVVSASAVSVTATRIKKASLTVAPTATFKTTGGSGSVLGTVTLTTGAGGSKLDINGGLNSGGYVFTGETAASIEALVMAGSGGSGFAAQTWDQPGIMSTQAQADTLTNSVGWMDNDNFILGGKAVFDGETVPGGAMLVKATVAGDADLSGVVDDDDVTVLGLFYGGAGKWYEGDFDYTGAIDDDDVTILGLTYGTSLGALPGALPGGVAAVPEPASLGLLALGATGLLRRRRRH